MGKGTIISHIADGQYNISVNFYRVQYNKIITVLDKNIANLTKKISEIGISLESYRILVLQRAALIARKKFIQDNFPDDRIIQAWCADLTEDLTGEVGTIEVPGEDTNIQIIPGYKDKSKYIESESGQLVPTIAQGTNEFLYNFCLFPGWQKWKPTYRYGTIVSKGDGVCNISLETALSSHQGLNINQTDTLSNVPFEYMSCNGAAFSEGDSVLIQFTGQDWSQPKVVGFKEEPKACMSDMLVIDFGGPYGDHQDMKMYLVWDLKENKPYNLLNPDDTPLEYPCSPSALLFAMRYMKMSNVLITYTEGNPNDVIINYHRPYIWSYDGQTVYDPYGTGTRTVTTPILIDEENTDNVTYKEFIYEQQTLNYPIYTGEVKKGPSAGKGISFINNYHYRNYTYMIFQPFSSRLFNYLDDEFECLLGRYEIYGEEKSEYTSTIEISGEYLFSTDVSTLQYDRGQIQIYLIQIISQPSLSPSFKVFAACDYYPDGDVLSKDCLLQVNNTDLEEEIVRCLDSLAVNVLYDPLIGGVGWDVKIELEIYAIR